MLKFIVSPIAGMAAFIASALVMALSGTEKSVIGFTIVVLIGIFSTIVTFNLFPKKSVKESVAESVSFVKNTTNEISAMVNNGDSDLYAIAEQEVDEGVINNGLWSQALVASDGDESKRKIEYMKLRVKQLKKR